MVAGVGNAVIAPLHNAGFSKSAGKGVPISEFELSSFENNNNQNNEITGSDSPISVALSPAGLNALAQSQKAENQTDQKDTESKNPALSDEKSKNNQTNQPDTENQDDTDNASVNASSANDSDVGNSQNADTDENPTKTGNPLVDAAASAASNDPDELTEEEEKQVEELKQRDQEVRQHEQAHKTVGGSYAGAIQYETTTGPDGREYVVAGEVDIDVSPVPNNPEATIRKMEVVERAALAPAEPSPQDIQVARAAQQARVQAQNELQEQKQAEQDGKSAETSKSPLQTSPIDDLQTGPDSSASSPSTNADKDESAALISILFGTGTA